MVVSSLLGNIHSHGGGEKSGGYAIPNTVGTKRWPGERPIERALPVVWGPFCD